MDKGSKKYIQPARIKVTDLHYLRFGHCSCFIYDKTLDDSCKTTLCQPLDVSLKESFPKPQKYNKKRKKKAQFQETLTHHTSQKHSIMKTIFTITF